MDWSAIHAERNESRGVGAGAQSMVSKDSGMDYGSNGMGKVRRSCFNGNQEIKKRQTSESRDSVNVLCSQRHSSMELASKNYEDKDVKRGKG